MPSNENERPTAMLVSDNSFAALCRAYKESAKFKGMRPNSQALWGRELDYACRPGCLGALPVDQIGPHLVEGYLDGWDDKPGKQAAALTAFKALEKWAVKRKLLPASITLGVETGKPQGGHVPWTDEQVAHGERYASPAIARVITLGANTGQRLSDLIRMCPTDIETYKGIRGINVTQTKTGREVWVPITKALAAAMTTWELRPGPFLLKPMGGLWQRDHLTHAWCWERDHNRAIEELKRAGLVLHGLRGHACVQLKRAGANAQQIADMVGMSIKMVERYCRLSVQKENAVAAVQHLDGTFAEQKAENVLKFER
jgi:integrase